MNKKDLFEFTIFIPTFNRAYLLDRAIDSVASQTLKDFELLIIDDGSTDNTMEIVQAWANKGISIKYDYQENQGKPSAHNRAIQLAQGHFIVILDSDDLLVPTALEELKKAWDNIPREKRNLFAGVEGCRVHLEDKKIAGTWFPKDVLDCTYLEMRNVYRVKGDKNGAVLTDVLKKFPFPIFPGEKHVRESLVWSRISGNYLFRYINIPIAYTEHFPDGLTYNHRKLRLENPEGYSVSFLEVLNFYYHYHGFRTLYGYAVRYARASLNAKKGLIKQYRELKRNKYIWFLAILEGFIGWLGDRIRILLELY